MSWERARPTTGQARMWYDRATPSMIGSGKRLRSIGPGEVGFPIDHACPSVIMKISERRCAHADRGTQSCVSGCVMWSRARRAVDSSCARCSGLASQPPSSRTCLPPTRLLRHRGSGRAVGVYPHQTRRRGQVAPAVVAGPDDCQRALVHRHEGHRCLTGGPRTLSRIQSGWRV